MALVATQWFPSDGESGRGLCTQPVNDISSAELPLGSALRPDSQTWMSSCEPSVRCVCSQRGGRTPITAALSRHWFPPCPLDHIHACGPPVGRFHWSPHSQLWPVVPFRLGAFKKHQQQQADWHSSAGQLCHISSWCCVPLIYVTKDSSVFARTKSSDVDLSFLVVTADSFSTKAPVKEKRETSVAVSLSICLSPSLAVQRIPRPRVEAFFSAPPSSAWLFSSAVQHIRTNISLEAFHNIWNRRRRIMSC